MLMYSLSPRKAYQQAGAPRGVLRTLSGSCKACSGALAHYSEAGKREARISRLCEPCFDYETQAVEDRDEIDAAWMRRVKHRR